MSRANPPSFSAFSATAQRLLNEPWQPVNGARQPSQLNTDMAAFLSYYQLPLPSEQLVFSSGCASNNATERLVWYRWQPTHPTRRALVVHGYMDHSGLYRHLIQHLLDNGCEVVCFDLPGHGLSSGERASIDSFDHYQEALDTLLEKIAEWPALPLIGCGQSTGGAIFLQHLVQHADNATAWRAINLLAPLFEPAGWGLNRVWLKLLSPFVRALPRSFKRNSGDSTFSDFLARQDPLQTRLIPLTWLRAMDRWIIAFRPQRCNAAVNIIQGDSDHTVAWRSNLRHFRSHFSAATITLIEGAEHQLVNETTELRAKIFAQLAL